MTGTSLESAFSARAELMEAVRGWHEAAGRPSVRRIAAPAGCSHSTVNDLLRGTRIPSWQRLAGIITYLNGDLEQARKLWQQAVPAAGTARFAIADTEAEAIRIAASALAQVTPAGQRRVLAYLQDRFAGEEDR